jgi:hypothetical protein
MSLCNITGFPKLSLSLEIQSSKLAGSEREMGGRRKEKGDRGGWKGRKDKEEGRSGWQMIESKVEWFAGRGQCIKKIFVTH